MLDPRVEDVLHVRPARVGDDRAVPERARPELHPPLEPADDVARRDPPGDERVELVVGEAGRLETGGGERARAVRLRVGGAGVGVVHHEPARAPELPVPDVVGGADRDPGVARGRLDEDVLERCLGADAPVRDRVQRHPAREADPRDPRALPEGADEVEVRLLQHRLEGGGDVLVRRSQLAVRLPRRPERLLELLRVETADRRRPLVPGHVDALLVVQEVVEPQLEEVAFRADDPAHLVEEARGAVRGQAHHLALVAVLGEAEPLGDRGVEDPERVREEHSLEDPERRSTALGQHRAGEVTEAVHGEDRRVLERRDEEGARHVRLVVLDVVQLGADLARREPPPARRERRGHARRSRAGPSRTAGSRRAAGCGAPCGRGSPSGRGRSRRGRDRPRRDRRRRGTRPRPAPGSPRSA